MTEGPSRLLIVAPHEATMDLVEPWATDGSMPVSRELIARGLSGRLFSRFPLLGPERWGNLVTGQDADRHGLTEFLHREGGEFKPIRFGSEHGLWTAPVWR